MGTRGIEQDQVHHASFKDRAITFTKGFAWIAGAILTLGISEVIRAIQSYNARTIQTGMMDAKAKLTLNRQ